MKGMWFSVMAAFAAMACSAATEGPGESTSNGAQDLAGGCRAVCPKCPPNQICPMIACYLDCHPKQCVQTAMCIQGYEWSASRCTCVPVHGKPASCTSDADCYAYSDYCSGGCNCEALSTHDPVPQACQDPVNCFADPCMNVTAVCLNGSCSLQ